MIMFSSTAKSGSTIRICSSADAKNRSWVMGTPLGNFVVPPVYNISAMSLPLAGDRLVSAEPFECADSSFRSV